MSTSTTTPTDFSDLIRSGFSLFRTSLKDIIGIFVLQIITVSCLFIGSLSLLLSLMANARHHHPAYTELVLVILAAFVIGSICLVFPVFYIKRFQSHTNNVAHENKAVLRHSIGYLKNLLLWTLVYLAIIFYLLIINALAQRATPLLLLAIPGFMLIVSLSMGPYLIVVEDYKPFKALVGSYRLVQGRWWRTALYLILIILILVMIMLGITIPLAFLFTLLAGVSVMLIGALQIINALTIAALLPLFIALIYPFYEDLKNSA